MKEGEKNRRARSRTSRPIETGHEGPAGLRGTEPGALGSPGSVPIPFNIATVVDLTNQLVSLLCCAFIAA
jgi:hypothetical protein